MNTKKKPSLKVIQKSLMARYAEWQAEGRALLKLVNKAKYEAVSLRFAAVQTENELKDASYRLEAGLASEAEQEDEDYET